MAILKLVPLWLWIALAAAGVLAIQHAQLTRAEAARDDYQEKLAAADLRIDSLRETLKLQRQLQTDIEKVAEDARLQTQTASRAAVVARTAGDSLQQQVDKLLAARKADGAKLAAGGKARAELVVVLADLRRSADETAGSLAEALDRSRIAGATCELAYDSLAKAVGQK